MVVASRPRPGYSRGAPPGPRPLDPAWSGGALAPCSALRGARRLGVVRGGAGDAATLHHLAGAGHDVVHAEAELLEDLLARRRRAEALQRDRGVDPLRPAHPDAGLNRDG